MNDCPYGMALSLGLTTDPCPRCNLKRDKLPTLPVLRGSFEGPFCRTDGSVSGAHQELRSGQVVHARGSLFTRVYDERIPQGARGVVRDTWVYGCPMLVLVQWDGRQIPPTSCSVGDLELEPESA